MYELRSSAWSGHGLPWYGDVARGEWGEPVIEPAPAFGTQVRMDQLLDGAPAGEGQA